MANTGRRNIAARPREAGFHTLDNHGAPSNDSFSPGWEPA